MSLTVGGDEAKIVRDLPSLIKTLSPFRRALLKEVFFALHLVSLKKEKNLMGPENLSTIFGIVLMSNALNSKGGMVNIVSSVMNPFDKSKFCRILIQEYPAIFADIDTLPLAGFAFL